MHLIILRHNWLFIYLPSHRQRVCAWQWRPSVNRLLMDMINCVSIGALIMPVGSKRGCFLLSEPGWGHGVAGGLFGSWGWDLLWVQLHFLWTKFRKTFHLFLLLGIKPILRLHSGELESQFQSACVFSKAQLCTEERTSTEHNKCLHGREIERNKHKWELS